MAGSLTIVSIPVLNRARSNANSKLSYLLGLVTNYQMKFHLRLGFVSH